MQQDNPRVIRVGDQIQRVLAEIIREEIKDPRIGMVTVSAVRVSRDLGKAKVYVTVMDDLHDEQDSVKILNRAAGHIRHELGRRMVIRTVPELKFIHDKSISHGSQLSALIDQAVAEDAKKPKHD